MNIPYAKQEIDEADIEAVVSVLKGDTLTTGQHVTTFERDICMATGAKYALAVSNGTAALHLAVLAIGITEGDEVIVPAITFAASANCVLYAGGTPVFADIESGSMLMDIQDVERKITKNTKAIIPVHYGGELCDMDAYETLANKYNLQIIQDCAHSLGGRINNKHQGEYSGQQIWSFHPAKNITTGEGGAITTNDEQLYKKLLKLRTHGITRDVTQYVNPNEGGWYYEMLDLGFNYRLTDIQCALGSSQLQKLERFAQRRREIVEKYNEAFRDFPLEIQQSPTYSNAMKHIYVIRLAEGLDRKNVFDQLTKKGLGVNVHYKPVYQLPYYQQLGYKDGLCPVAEKAYAQMITLPLFTQMTDEMVAYVIDAVREVIC